MWLCVFPDVVTFNKLEKKHGRISRAHSQDFAQYCKFIQPMPIFCVILTPLIVGPVYTRDPHTLFLVSVVGLVPTSARPSACAVSNTKLYMLQSVVIDIFIVAFEPHDAIHNVWLDVKKYLSTYEIGVLWLCDTDDVKLSVGNSSGYVIRRSW